MPYNRPTIHEIRERVAADMEQYSAGGDPNLPGSLEYTVTNAVTGVSHGLHGRIAWLVKQMFDATADDDYLLLRAGEMGIYQIAGYRAEGTASITGSDGATVATGEVYESNAGTRYIVQADAVIAAGTAVITLRAMDTGAAGNLPAGETLTLINSVAGIEPQATVIAIAAGADVEPISRVRERLAERKQNPPMGGAPHDYIAWAKAAHPDVTRAWCYSNENGPGTVVVRFVTDNLPSPIPEAAVINVVKDYIDTKRPAGMAGFDVATLVVKPLDITFTQLTPNTAAVQQAVQAELDDMIRREAVPGGTIKLSWIHEAISIAQGETDHAIDIDTDVPALANELIILGNIVWPV